MPLKTGTSRLVYVGEKTTVKTPRLNPFDGWRSVQRAWTKGRLWNLLTAPEEYHGSPSWLRGFVANKNEGEYSKVLGDLVVPTRTHLGGLFATQPTTEDITLNVFAVLDALFDSDMRRPLNRYGAHLGHTLSRSQNYGLLNGELRLRDFGDSNAIDFLLQFKKETASGLRSLEEAAKSMKK